jgi:hypothetical protein
LKRAIQNSLAHFELLLLLTDPDAATVAGPVAATTEVPLVLPLLPLALLLLVLVLVVLLVVCVVVLVVVPASSCLRFSILLCDHRQREKERLAAGVPFHNKPHLDWPTGWSPPSYQAVGFCDGGETGAGYSRHPCGIALGVGWPWAAEFSGMKKAKSRSVQSNLGFLFFLTSDSFLCLTAGGRHLLAAGVTLAG